MIERFTLYVGKYHTIVNYPEPVELWQPHRKGKEIEERKVAKLAPVRPRAFLVIFSYFMKKTIPEPL